MARLHRSSPGHALIMPMTVCAAIIGFCVMFAVFTPE
jgi:hypothetical protein